MESILTEVMQCRCGWTGHNKKVINNKKQFNACPRCGRDPYTLSRFQIAKMGRKGEKLKEKFKLKF